MFNLLFIYKKMKLWLWHASRIASLYGNVMQRSILPRLNTASYEIEGPPVNGRCAPIAVAVRSGRKMGQPLYVTNYE